jgi:hypothetical protein
VTVKDMGTGEQSRVPRDGVVEHCRALVRGGRE